MACRTPQNGVLVGCPHEQWGLIPPGAPASVGGRDGRATLAMALSGWGHLLPPVGHGGGPCTGADGAGNPLASGWPPVYPSSGPSDLT